MTTIYFNLHLMKRYIFFDIIYPDILKKTPETSYEMEII